MNNITSRAENLKIIGGTDVKPGEYPMIALVHGGKCTGVLVHPRWVLTAAHCVDWLTFPYVNVGITKAEDYLRGNFRSIQEQIVHKDFDWDTMENDLALILIDKEITGIPFAKLPQKNKDEQMYEEGNIVTAAGWGVIGYEPTPTISPLQEEINRNILWKYCLQNKTLEDCNKFARPHCGYNIFCNVCMPWNDPKIDISGEKENCERLQVKAMQIVNDSSLPAKVTAPPVKPVPVPIRPDTLQKISLPIIDSRKYPPGLNQFTIGYDDEKSSIYNTSSGDSGGPVFYKKDDELYLLGIESHVNFYIETGTPSGPSFATKIIDYTDWIEEIISRTSIYDPTPSPSPKPTLYLPMVIKKYKSATSTPIPSPDPAQIERIHRVVQCYQYMSEDKCHKDEFYIGCDFWQICQVCIPGEWMTYGDQSSIPPDYCSNLKKKIEETILQQEK